MRSSTAFIASIVVAFASSARAQAPTLERVLGAFSELRGLTAEFHETKRIALLAVPVESDGVIRFMPGKLYREVTRPTRSVALVEGDRLTMSSGGERQEIDLSDNPIVGGFVGTFRHVLAGDRAALEQTYTLDFQVQGDAWTLTLRPRSEALRRFLTSLRLVGRGQAIERTVMTERTGDVTETTFSNVDPDHEWTAAERRTQFRVP